jgi:hypothetical protein
MSLKLKVLELLLRGRQLASLARSSSRTVLEQFRWTMQTNDKKKKKKASLLELQRLAVYDIAHEESGIQQIPCLPQKRERAFQCIPYHFSAHLQRDEMRVIGDWLKIFGPKNGSTSHQLNFGIFCFVLFPSKHPSHIKNTN